MKPPSIAERLAVCSWSLQPAHPQDLVSKLLATGIHRVQLALDPLREWRPVWGEAPALLRQNNITVASGMFGCVGEDYSSLKSIQATGGVTPDSTWDQNWKNIQTTALLAKKLDLKLVTFHAGFLPHDERDPAFAKLLQRLAKIADAFHAHKIEVALETGQETAFALAAFLAKLKRHNVGVNFDPANMILYDQGNPIDALSVLGPWIRQVHVKDARRTRAPGAWGEEVAVGSGEVDWDAFMGVLKKLKFRGSFCIERESGKERVADIRQAKSVIEKIAA